MARLIKILFTNIGRRTYLIQSALELGKKYYPGIKIYASETNLHNAGLMVSDQVTPLLIPKVSMGQKNYIQTLIKKCIKEKINIVIPLVDYELSVLSRNKELFDKRGIKIIISDYSIVDICMNKKRNYYFCLENGISVPRSFFSLSGLPRNTPLVIKKIYGSGSFGLKTINNLKELTSFNERDEFLQKKIEGREYNIDILNDLNGNFVHACIKEKILMRAGETDKAIIKQHDKLFNESKKISRIFQHVGNMDIDVIEDKKGNFFFLDFNPRFGGGYAFTHAVGYNYLRYIIDICLNKKIRLHKNRQKDILLAKGISVYMPKAEVGRC